jgi:DNA-binding CsgD family transcriptional regulator
MAERVGDHAALVAALRARQMARSGPDGTAERLALGDRMLAIGAQGDADAALWGRLWRFDALAQLGHIDRAESELDRIASASERLRSPLGHWHLTRSQGAIAVARGRFPEAVSLGQEAIGLAEKAGHEGAVIPSLGFLALVCSLTGARELPLDRGQQNTGSAFTAIWHLAVGRHEDARRIYVGLPPPTAVPGFFLLSYLGAVAVLAEAFDDRTAAADVLNRLAPFAELFLSGGAGVIAVWGSVHLPMGLAAGTLGHVDEAVGHLRAAVAANDRAGCPPFTATSRYHLARVLARRRRPGDREEAAALGASAESHAAQLGMAPLRRQAGQLSASLAGGKAGPLTRREEEIAALVAQGLTNRQVAAVTHIAERTAENHVGHILTKLGFVNRAQIAAWVARGRR